MIMSFGNGPESSASKAVHLTGRLSSVDGRVDGNNQTATAELPYYLRVKPDRRRVKAAYPPQLERRRRVIS
jgi:hypothetical protein